MRSYCLIFFCAFLFCRFTDQMRISWNRDVWHQVVIMSEKQDGNVWELLSEASVSSWTRGQWITAPKWKTPCHDSSLSSRVAFCPGMPLILLKINAMSPLLDDEDTQRAHTSTKAQRCAFCWGHLPKLSHRPNGGNGNVEYTLVNTPFI